METFKNHLLSDKSETKMLQVTQELLLIALQVDLQGRQNRKLTIGLMSTNFFLV